MPLFSELLSIGGKSLVEYTYIFLIGYYIFSNDHVISKTEKFKWISLFIGFSASFLNVYLFIWSDTQYPIFNTAVKFVSEWFMLIALLGMGKCFLNFSSKVTIYMSQRSFAFYILHFIWIVLFQYFIYDICQNNTILLYIVPVLLAFSATFLCCEICIRTPFLCTLMGIKCINKKNH